MIPFGKVCIAWGLSGCSEEEQIRMTLGRSTIDCHNFMAVYAAFGQLVRSIKIIREFLIGNDHE